MVQGEANGKNSPLLSELVFVSGYYRIALLKFYTKTFLSGMTRGKK